jgi:hypothetical protein
MTAAARPDIRTCLTCGNPYLEGYPHRHATDPRADYDPMPPKPAGRAALVAVIAREYGAEKPTRLHVHQVPSRTEPIAVSQYSAAAAGMVTTEVSVLDAGELGAPPWAPSFHRYIGGIRLFDDEMVTTELDPQAFPWTRNLHSLRRWCAGKHRDWYDHGARPLCWTLIGLVVVAGYDLDRAAAEAGVPVDVADVLLFGHRDRDCDHVGRCPPGALDRWWSWTSNDLNDVALRRVRVA